MLIFSLILKKKCVILRRLNKKHSENGVKSGKVFKRVSVSGREKERKLLFQTYGMFS